MSLTQLAFANALGGPRRVRGGALAAVLFLVGSTLLAGCKPPEETAAGATSAPAQPTAPASPVHVETVAAENLSVPRTLHLTGNLRGAKETELAANVAGTLTATLVERGQAVKEGQVLARVDVRAASLALAEAKVQVENTELQQSISTADCARYEQLKARGVVTDLEYDQVTAKCKVAPLSIEAAKARQSILAKNVGDGIIRSPFAGVVTERYVEVGEYVQPSSRVVSLAQVDELRLEFTIPEQNFPSVKVGAAVQFQVSAYPGETFAASVSHVSGAVRPTRDVLIEATVANAEHKLLPGMFAEVALAIGMEELPAVPAAAVFDKNGKQNIFVVVGDSLEQRVVQPAAVLGGQIPLRRGVSAGERVVAADLADLKNGQKVN